MGVGGRIGYLVTPQILAYVNGGWSSTRFSGDCQHIRLTADLSAAAPK